MAQTDRKISAYGQSSPGDILRVECLKSEVFHSRRCRFACRETEACCVALAQGQERHPGGMAHHGGASGSGKVAFQSRPPHAAAAAAAGHRHLRAARARGSGPGAQEAQVRAAPLPRSPLPAHLQTIVTPTATATACTSPLQGMCSLQCEACKLMVHGFGEQLFIESCTRKVPILSSKSMERPCLGRVCTMQRRMQGWRWSPAVMPLCAGSPGSPQPWSRRCRG